MIKTDTPPKEMDKFLYFCPKHVNFSYGWIMYIQVYGVAMASPLGPVLANIFGADLEFSTVP